MSNVIKLRVYLTSSNTFNYLVKRSCDYALVITLSLIKSLLARSFDAKVRYHQRRNCLALNAA